MRFKEKKTIRGLMIFSVMILCLFLMTSIVSAQYTGDLIINGSFENGKLYPDNWLIPTSEIVEFIMADPYHGRVLKISGEDFSSTKTLEYGSPRFPREVESPLFFQADIKTLDKDLTVTIIGYACVQGKSEPRYRTFKTFKTDNGAWRGVTHEFYPECRYYKIESLEIIFSIEGEGGCVFIDNVQVSPSPSPNV